MFCPALRLFFSFMQAQNLIFGIESQLCILTSVSRYTVPKFWPLWLQLEGGVLNCPCDCWNISVRKEDFSGFLPILLQPPKLHLLTVRSCFSGKGSEGKQNLDIWRVTFYIVGECERVFQGVGHECPVSLPNSFEIYHASQAHLVGGVVLLRCRFLACFSVTLKDSLVFVCVCPSMGNEGGNTGRWQATLKIWANMFWGTFPACWFLHMYLVRSFVCLLFFFGCSIPHMVCTYILINQISRYLTWRFWSLGNCQKTRMKSSLPLKNLEARLQLLWIKLTCASVHKVSGLLNWRCSY